MNRSARVLAVTVAVFLGIGAAFAAEPEPLQRSNATTLWFENWGSMYNATLTVSGPDGFYSSTFFASGAPQFFLRDIGTPAPDGVYHYELSAATTETVELKNQLDQGRGDASRSEAAVPFVTGGQFVVERGVIVIPDEQAEEESR